MIIALRSLITRFSIVLAVAGFVPAADVQAANPTWLGRPFVKVVHQGDPIPGTAGDTFGELTWFTLRDGTIHLVGGGSSSRKGVFRWRDGTLTSLVYTNTVAPSGAKFDTVHAVTDETGGALNFFGEVYFGKPGFIYGLFELRNGNVTTVFDTANTYNGITFMGFGYPVRVGNEVVWGGQFIGANGQKSGIFRWDGTTLRKLVDSDTDLPGSLGNYGGSPPYGFSFDGQSVGFIGQEDTGMANAPRGVYRVSADSTVTKVVDVNDPLPGDRFNRTYLQRSKTFATVDVDGTNTFFETSGVVAAAGGGRNQFYNLGTRVTDGVPEDVLGAFINGLPPQLDGREISTMSLVDGHGDDVAFMVHFNDQTRGIYAVIGSGAAPVNVTLGRPTFASGTVRFRIPTLTGKSYIVEFSPTLSAGTWTTRTTLAGTGADLEFSEAISGGAGYYRVSITTP